MDYKTVLLLQHMATIGLACFLGPLLVWRFRRKLWWAARAVDWLFDLATG